MNAHSETLLGILYSDGRIEHSLSIEVAEMGL